MLAPFVDAAFLEAHRGEVTLADVRWYPDGRAAVAGFEAAHLRGAVFVDLETACAGRSGGGRHPLPEPAEFAASMTAAGIGEDDTVIAYDDCGGVVAARLVWMLRATGHEAALLDGGMAGFEELDTGPPRVPDHKPFSPRPWPEALLAGLGDVTERANVVIDARERQRYEGEEHRLDRRRGHVPGARSVPCRENLDATGRLLRPSVMRARFEQAGVRAGEPPVVYCGSGVTACHDLLVLEHVGLGEGRLYPGSWSEYEQDEDRPAVVGPDPG